MFYSIKANKVTRKLLSCLLLLQTTCWSDHLQHQDEKSTHYILFWLLLRQSFAIIYVASWNLTFGHLFGFWSDYFWTVCHCDMASDYGGFVCLSPILTFKIDWCISLVLNGFWSVYNVYTLLKIKVPRCHRRTFLSKWFHKEPLTSEEPFCFTKASLWWKKVLQIIKR